MSFKTNDVILKTVSTMLVFIILSFGIYLFFVGHNAPGGGFIGGLITSGALLLLYMAFDFNVMYRLITINFRVLFGIGLLIAVLTGIASLLVGQPFLSHTFGHFHIPFFGDIELATAMLFDLGVYLTVIGITMTIILSISEDA